MRIIGIDPGTKHLGWGVIERGAGRPKLVACGAVRAGDKPLPERLALIAAELRVVLEQHQPTVAVVETIFVQKDPSAAVKLAHARGVAILLLGERQIAVRELAASAVRRRILGKGSADKAQVARMVRAVLAITEPLRLDVTDALALALAA